MRLIDADALTKILQEVLDEHKHEEDNVVDIAFRLFIGQIAIAPTIEAEPVRHGRWNIRTYLPREGYYCSECRTVEWRTSRFCPYCGAKMDGGEKKNE